MTGAADRRALVIGDSGQDGRYLVQHLGRAGWQVTGLDDVRLALPDGSSAAAVPLGDAGAVGELLARVAPERIFYLAAYHGSSEARETEDPFAGFDQSVAVNLLGVANVLKAVARADRGQRVCYAASSHIFGAPSAEPQTEATPVRPSSAYAVSKLAGLETCRWFRRSHGVFVSGAILYNHESPLRPDSFVTQKIATAAADASLGRDGRLVLRDVWACADWGAAEDYVRAMDLMLDLAAPDDFIVASGRKRSVAAFAETAYAHVGLDWKDFVHSRAAPPSSAPAPALVGDASLLRQATGWRPQVSFESLVAAMVDAAVARRSAG